MDLRGIVIYLVLAFGLVTAITWGLSSAEIVTYQNRSSYGVATFFALLLVPAVAGFNAGALGTARHAPRPSVWPLPLKPLFLIVIGVPLVIYGAYAVESLMGITSPDWTLNQLTRQLPSAEEVGLPEPLPPLFFLFAGAAIDIVLGATFYALFGAAFTYGWVAYFMPAITRIGRVPTYLIAGGLMGLWFAPIVYADAAGILEPQSTLVRTVALAIVMAAILGELYKRTEHLGLCGVFAGTWLAHVWGMPGYLFRVNPPEGGPLGYVAITFWLIIAVAVFLWRHETKLEEQTSTA